MVDRGGLNYPIRVRDEFSKNTQLFRKEIGASKKAFDAFQKTLRGGKSTAATSRANAKGLRDQTKAQRANTKATKAGTKPLSDREKQAKATHAANKKLSRSIAEIARQQKARERTAIALRNAQSADLRRQNALIKANERKALADRKAKQATDANFQANKRLNAELFRQKVALKEIALLKAAAASQRARGDIIGSQATLKRAQGLEKSLKGSAKQAKSIFFTFRRLVGTLAIFTLARKGVQTFNQLVKEGIKFNDTVATAQLGIAGLVATLADVRNAQGQNVGATEELNLALGVAREQTAKLRQDSLKTVATFEQLLDTFQVSVGPGLAAGLNLDEVRQLTVDISQAASALGVPQNQLAEEVRSLLSGTIQARTTRIATALGISNEDVRRLKETGELFDFLEEKFSGFAEAAERQARTTFTGITTLIKGLVQEVLGEAARPLFEELIELGNDLFDNFLSIKDAAGNIKPSPEVVAAFQQVFDALKRTVVAFRELGSGTAINTLDSVLAGIAITIDFISGAAVQIVNLFATAGGLVKEFAQFLNLSSNEAGATAAFFGKWAVNLLVAFQIFKRMNVGMLKFVGRAGIVVAAFVAIAKAVEFVLEKIFGVNLNIKDTIELVSLGLLGAWFEFTNAISVASQKISNGFGAAIDAIVAKTKSGALRARAAVNEFFFDDVEAQELKDRAFEIESAAKKERQARARANQLELDDIKSQTEAKLQAVQDEIAKTVALRVAENNKGEGFRDGFDPKKAAADAEAAAKSFVSTSSRPIADLGESLGKVNTEIEKSSELFDQAQRSAAAGGVGGIAGSVESTFDKEELARNERLKKIKIELLQVEAAIVRLREAGVGETEGALVSALTDQANLKNAILNADEQSLELAGIKAATQATLVLPGLADETAALQAQVAAERAKTNAVNANLGSRQMALVAAQSAVSLANQELAAVTKRNQAEIKSLQTQAAKLPPGAELAALNAVIDALAVRQGFEEEILRLRQEQLLAAQAEAELVANGSMTEGLARGFEEFSKQFSSTFQAGINIARAAVDGLAQFASQAIVDAFDPTKEVDIVERFARLMQQIAQTILQELIQLAIAKALIKNISGEGEGQDDSSVTGATAVGAIRVATETTVASIKLANALAIAAIKAASGGFSQGGLALAKGGQVPHTSIYAQGLARGGKPSRIPDSDTIPAWLTPGEFVMRKSAVQNIGLSQLQAMNGGNMQVVGSSSAEAAGPSTGMASGGLVADQIASSSAASESEGGGGASTIVVPAIVARDGEMDKLTAGGKSAMLAFMRQNAGNINSLLDRSNGRGN
jgi:hypothetical protein